jgi:uncharacterized small protein (DUF1192 family)
MPHEPLEPDALRDLLATTYRADDPEIQKLLAAYGAATNHGEAALAMFELTKKQGLVIHTLDDLADRFAKEAKRAIIGFGLTTRCRCELLAVWRSQLQRQSGQSVIRDWGTAMGESIGCWAKGRPVGYETIRRWADNGERPALWWEDWLNLEKVMAGKVREPWKYFTDRAQKELGEKEERDPLNPDPPPPPPRKKGETPIQEHLKGEEERHTSNKYDADAQELLGAEPDDYDAMFEDLISVLIGNTDADSLAKAVLTVEELQRLVRRTATLLPEITRLLVDLRAKDAEMDALRSEMEALVQRPTEPTP